MTPTDLETLRGLVKEASAFQKQLDDGDGAYPSDYHDMVAKLSDAIPALTALLADYEQMREWLPKAEHITGCEARKPMTYRILHDTYPDGEVPCICGLDALRATLSEGERG